MKKFSKKGVLLFGAAMAVCAFAMPSMASASSWGVVGTHHTLTSADLGFTAPALGLSSMCTSSSFTARVVSTAVIEITTGSFSGCTLADPSIGVTSCTMTPVGTNFPWTATARTTSDIQIHGVNIDVPLENHPGGGVCAPLAGTSLKITGTLTNARWQGNAGARRIDLTNSHGLAAHPPAGFGATVAVTATGLVTDTAETITVTN